MIREGGDDLVSEMQGTVKEKVRPSRRDGENP
jgi:hypothetical protein